MARLLNKSQKLGALKITVQKWYLPDGNSTQVRGVPSDIALPSINEYLPLSESDLDNPMPWDSITSVPWTQTYLDDYTDTVNEGSLKVLNKASQYRQGKLEEFKILKENLETFKRKKDQKEFSLNLAVREKERKADNAVREQVKARLKKIADQEYEYQEVQLDSVIEQEGKSKSEVEEQIVDDTEDDDGLPSFDIHERESLRIMADYLAELAGEKLMMANGA